MRTTNSHLNDMLYDLTPDNTIMLMTVMIVVVMIMKMILRMVTMTMKTLRITQSVLHDAMIAGFLTSHLIDGTLKKSTGDLWQL